MNHRSRKRITSLLSSLALVAASTVGLAASAAAAGEQGYLLIHGVGSVFSAGRSSDTTIAVNAGGAATFTFEVKNSGTTTNQYNVSLVNEAITCPTACSIPTLTLTTGSLTPTALAIGPNGYFTAPIAPGKAASYTLKATVAAGTPAGDIFRQVVVLQDTAHNALDDAVTAEDVVSTAKGTANNDLYVTGSGGQKAVGAPYPGEVGYVTDPTVKVGAKTTFTVKLENDGAETTAIGFALFDASYCGNLFPATVKAGSTDITAAALAGTYQTAPLTTGKSATLTVTVTYIGPLSACDSPYKGADMWQSQAIFGSSTQRVDMITNAYAS